MRTIPIEAVRLIDGVADAAREHVDVVVDGERIAAIDAHDPLPADPDGSARTRIDGTGRTLLPGLIDAHAHYTFDPTEGSIATIARRSDAEIVLAAAGHAGEGPASRRDHRARRRLDPQSRDRSCATRSRRAGARGHASSLPARPSASPAGTASSSGSRRTAPPRS